jgi:glycosyltransferase involved in cell wall biosynthesis
MTATPDIVHVASGREWRGGQRQVWYLARALTRDSSLTQLVVTGRGSRLARHLRDDGVSVMEVPWGPAFDPRALTGLLRALPGPPCRPIVHAHDSHALLLAVLAARRPRVRLVASRRVDFPLRTGWSWRRADRIVAISEAVRGVLLAGGMDPAKVTVVHSGVPLDEAPAAVDLRSGLGLDAAARLAVTVGALVRHKDHATLVAAAGLLRDRLPDLHWVVAGEGPLRALLERQVRAMGLERRVHLLGEVTDGRAVLAAGDLCVVSSREEGLNTSVLDAMALGVPVVATDAGGLPEALGGGAGLLCPRERPAALAELVARALADAALRKRLREAARVAVRRFSTDRMAAGMRSVYDSLAHNR